jgi:hypothetical protein
MHVSQETAEERWHSDSPAVRYGYSGRTACNFAIRAAEDLRVNGTMIGPNRAGVNAGFR